MKNWGNGAVAKRRTTTSTPSAADFRAGVMRTSRDSAAGLMHSMIYFGFLLLMGVTTVLEIDHQMPESLKFLHGTTYKAYVGDFAGTVFTVKVIWAIVRRYIQRPYRIRIKTKTEHAVILGTFLAIGLTGFIAEGFRIALDGMPDYEKFSFVGYPLATLVDGILGLGGEHLASVELDAHVVSFVCSWRSFPSMLRHVLPHRSTCTCVTKIARRPMKPMPNLMETELESFGHRSLKTSRGNSCSILTPAMCGVARACAHSRNR